MRQQWRLRVYRDERKYPVAGIFDTFARLRATRWMRRRGRVPVLVLRDGSVEMNCPSCGSWWPVRAGEPQEADGPAVGLDWSDRRLRVHRLPAMLVDGKCVLAQVVCPAWQAQELGHPYPRTQCDGGRFEVEAGVLRRVARGT